MTRRPARLRSRQGPLAPPTAGPTSARCVAPTGTLTKARRRRTTFRRKRDAARFVISHEKTADRRLLTWKRRQNRRGQDDGPRATLRLRKDDEDLSTSAEIACGAPLSCRRFTRNKGASFWLVAPFQNNGHDDRSRTVLAPSFPSRRVVGDQCSDPSLPGHSYCVGLLWMDRFSEHSSSIVRRAGFLIPPPTGLRIPAALHGKALCFPAWVRVSTPLWRSCAKDGDALARTYACVHP
jgi:hypothetical protein